MPVRSSPAAASPLASIARLRGPGTRSEAAARQLREHIVTGALPPGAVLKDLEVAARLGLSPVPIREAMVQLAAEGLVETRPNRSRRVAPLDHDAMVELLDVKQAVWELGYARGAPRLTQADVALLHAVHAGYETACASADLDGAIRTAMDFHRVFLEAAGNRELIRVCLDRLPLVRRFILLAAPGMLTDETLAMHRRMLDAVAGGRAADCVPIFRDVGAHLLRRARAARDDHDATGTRNAG